eukprot:COSAG02_NODE_4898_length_4851_cov_5.166667_2_plen_184_part_00
MSFMVHSLTTLLYHPCQAIGGREPQWVTRERAHLEETMAVRLTTDAELLKEHYEMDHHKSFAADIAVRMHRWRGRVSVPKTISLAASGINPDLRQKLICIFYRLDQHGAGSLTFEQLHSFAEDGILAHEHLVMAVDTTGKITATEWLDAWENRGHSEAEIREFVATADAKLDELDELDRSQAS